MLENKNRIGNFTSSQIYKLCGAPAPIKTYVAKKNLERKLNTSIETEAYSQPMAWGTFLEQRVHEFLGLDYILCSNETDVHPTISSWAGSKDFIVKGKKVAELKCYQLENFALYTDAILSKDVKFIKEEFPKEYWQAVSNAIINNVKVAELISYCPFESELPEIKDMALNYSGDDAWKYRFIYESNALPCIKDGGFYNNLNTFSFEVPKEDIDFLTNRVLESQKKLNKFYKPVETIVG